MSDAPPSDAAAVHRFATLGDSITAGTLQDAGPLWPRLVTDWLATHTSDVCHLNFAVGGAMSGDVLAEQVPLALASSADLITVICGANDVLFCPRPDIDAAGANLRECLRRIGERTPPGRVVTATYPDFVPLLPWRPRSRARVATGLSHLNELIRRAAGSAGVLCVDLAAASQRYGSEVYARDGAHPSELGHQWIAIAMSAALAGALELPDPRTFWEAA